MVDKNNNQKAQNKPKMKLLKMCCLYDLNVQGKKKS